MPRSLPRQARAAVRDAMARPEFDYSPSTLERISSGSASSSQLLRARRDRGRGSFGGGIGTLFGWLIIARGAALVVKVAVWVIANPQPSRKRGGTRSLSPTEVEHRRAGPTSGAPMPSA